jgi:PAS domain S-box-containing protein
MIRIALISQDARQSELFRVAFDDHNREIPRQPYETHDYELVVYPATHHEDVDSLSIEADVVVARGFLATALLERNYFIPVVEIPINVSDLTRCLNQVEASIIHPRVAVVGSYRLTSPIVELANLFDFPLHAFTVRSRQDGVDVYLQAAVRAGCNVVVGGKRASEVAAQYGLQPFFVESGRESVWHAIGEAKRVAYISRREKEKSHSLSVVVNQAFDGIVTVNEQGRIALVNKAAQRLLNIQQQRAVGKSVAELFGDSKLAAALAGPSRLSAEVLEHWGRFLTVNKAPIEIDGQPLGTLVTLQDVTSIQRLETQIRQKIHPRGLVAKHRFDDIIGEHPRIRQAVAMAEHFAGVDSSVLILGETGTGKELFAQSIHNASQRSRGPFVAINCAALSETLLESELFGYAPGAFTGAARDGKSGLFELAHRGTIFLDEIAEIPPRLQLLLLRVLQEREIMRLGDNRVIPVDVRVLASSNRDLSELVRARQFREDLFYRLDVLRLHVPTLGARRSDVPHIADHWIAALAKVFGKEPRVLSEDARRHLELQEWPGNVRQLRSVCERLVVLSHTPIIDRDQVEVALANGRASHEGAPQGVETSGASGPQRGTAELDVPESQERAALLVALRHAGFSRTKTAESLGIGRTTLWRKLKKFNLTRDRDLGDGD